MRLNARQDVATQARERGACSVSRLPYDSTYDRRRTRGRGRCSSPVQCLLSPPFLRCFLRTGQRREPCAPLLHRLPASTQLQRRPQEPTGTSHTRSPRVRRRALARPPLTPDSGVSAPCLWPSAWRPTTWKRLRPELRLSLCPRADPRASRRRASRAHRLSRARFGEQSSGCTLATRCARRNARVHSKGP